MLCALTLPAKSDGYRAACSPRPPPEYARRPVPQISSSSSKALRSGCGSPRPRLPTCRSGNAPRVEGRLQRTHGIEITIVRCWYCARVASAQECPNGHDIESLQKQAHHLEGATGRAQPSRWAGWRTPGCHRTLAGRARSAQPPRGSQGGCRSRGGSGDGPSSDLYHTAGQTASRA